jgi:hypothetical protein
MKYMANFALLGFQKFNSAPLTSDKHNFVSKVFFSSDKKSTYFHAVNFTSFLYFVFIYHKSTTHISNNMNTEYDLKTRVIKICVIYISSCT